MNIRTIHWAVIIFVTIAETVNEHKVNDLCIFVATVKCCCFCHDFTIIKWHEDFIRNSIFIRCPHSDNRFCIFSCFCWHFHCDFTICKCHKSLVKCHIVPVCPHAFCCLCRHCKFTTTQLVCQQFREFCLVTIHLHDRVEFTETVIYFIWICVIVILLAINQQLIEICTRTEQHCHFIQSLFVQCQIWCQRWHPVVHLTSNLNTTNLASIWIVCECIIQLIAFAHWYRVCHTIHPKVNIRHRVHLFSTIKVKRKFILAQRHSKSRVCRRNRIHTRWVNHKVTCQHFCRTYIHQRKRVSSYAHRFVRLITNLWRFTTSH